MTRGSFDSSGSSVCCASRSSGGFVGGIWYEAKPPDYEYAVGFKSEQEEKEHKAKLAYHGLAYDVAVIYRDRIGQYFIRDGKRCPFVIPNKRQLAAR